MNFAISADYRMKIKESEKKDKYVDLTRELKTTMDHKDDGDTNYGWCTYDNPQRRWKKKLKTNISEEQEATQNQTE